jgi:uncharacterized protein (TIGR02145 family)
MKNTPILNGSLRFNLLFFGFLCFTSNIYSQDYEIRFAGSGSSTSVASVKVENLTKSTSVSLAGNDVLHLKSIISGTTPLEASTENKIKVYPNPVEESCQFEFSTSKTGNVLIEITDISGKSIQQVRSNLPSGSHLYQLNGLNSGIYNLSIITENYSASTKLTCSSSKFSKLVNINKVNDEVRANHPQRTENSGIKKAVLESVMQYNTGDLLKYTGISGNFTTIIMDIPTENKTITFKFIQCTDPDNRNYAVVQIGKQIWMAENLAYLPKVNPASEGSDKQQYCYVYGYNGTNINEAKATVNYAKYGVLYNWAAAMNGTGSSSANPSGIKGISPEGWHLPSDAEWTELETAVGGSMVAGTKLKSKAGWNSDDKRTDEFGFNALPAGYRYYGATFFGNGSNASFWTATKKDAVYGFSRSIDYNYEDIEHAESIEDSGFSIRCIKD